MLALPLWSSAMPSLPVWMLPDPSSVDPGKEHSTWFIFSRRTTEPLAARWLKQRSPRVHLFKDLASIIGVSACESQSKAPTVKTKSCRRCQTTDDFPDNRGHG